MGRPKARPRIYVRFAAGRGRSPDQQSGGTVAACDLRVASVAPRATPPNPIQLSRRHSGVDASAAVSVSACTRGRGRLQIILARFVYQRVARNLFENGGQASLGRCSRPASLGLWACSYRGLERVSVRLPGGLGEAEEAETQLRARHWRTWTMGRSCSSLLLDAHSVHVAAPSCCPVTPPSAFTRAEWRS